MPVTLIDTAQSGISHGCQNFLFLLTTPTLQGAVQLGCPSFFDRFANGEDRPVAPNTTKEGKQQNRRIEFFRVK